MGLFYFSLTVQVVGLFFFGRVMASKSLGTLTLDLIAKIGGFESGMDRAARTADRRGKEIAAAQRKAAKQTEEAWSKVGEVIGGVLAGITVGMVYQKFIKETREAEQEQAQLAAVIKSTGEAAGWSQDKLNTMADIMSKASIFDAGEINQAQTRLLSYTGVVGEEFPRAMQAAIDMASRMGMDVKQAAETVGKALDSPKDGLSALSKQGFRFTDDQKALVEQLQATGRTAEAQAIILGALESSYGGAAFAARDTFGGALSALQNNINDLLTGDSGSMVKLKASVESLNTTLAAPQTREAFAALIGWMTDLSTASIRGAANLVTFINTKNKLDLFTGKDLVLRDQAKNASAEGNKLVGDLERLDAQLKKDPGNVALQSAFDATRTKLDATMKRAAAASDALKGMADIISPPVASAATMPKPGPTTRPPATGTPAKPGAGGKTKAATDPNAAAEAYIRQLNEQIGKVNELTAVEKFLYDLQTEKVTMTKAQIDLGLRLSTEIDDTKKLAEQKKSDLELTQAQTSALREFNATMDQYARQLQGFGMGNKFREKAGGVQQIDDKYAEDLRRLEDSKRQAVYDGKWDSAAEERYAKELAMVLGFKDSALAAYEDYWAKKTRLEGDWSVGASEAVRNYFDEAANVAKQTEDLVSGGLKGMEDALTSFVTTGKGDFKGLVNSIAADLARMEIKSGMASLLGTGKSGGGGGGLGLFSAIAGLFGFADGGPTPPGGKYKPVGIVHAGENVWSQADISRAGGMAVVEAMRLGGRGYSSGGVVGAPPRIVTARGGGMGGGVGAASQAPGYAPVINVDARADRAAVYADVQRLLAENNKAYTEQLKRTKVIPQ